jgi:hypothetical protein
MAEETTAKDQNAPSPAEALATSGKNFFKLLTWIIPAIILGFILYMIFIGSDPRRQYDGFQETLDAYTQIVTPFVGPAPIRPDVSIVDQILDFYDKDTRDFFNKNFRIMAQIGTLGEPDRFASLSERGMRSEAMVWFLSHPPLNGVAGIEEQRGTTPQQVVLIVRSRDLTVHTMTMEESGGVWLIDDVAGLRNQFEQRFQQFRASNPDAVPES